ncbi:hypothetical protein CCUS01_06146 [Colletotrichum cuscutae]|uniref:Uncharacterized protein n=1 Tax=Colletotrichum cuscutae TaxID=1209917 RepID=A0AAI9Y4U4_9PEZI|nr:hypothetical protein CCUS01_06146 [Colletotrichum cuscutae]
MALALGQRDHRKEELGVFCQSLDILYSYVGRASQGVAGFSLLPPEAEISTASEQSWRQVCAVPRRSSSWIAWPYDWSVDWKKPRPNEWEGGCEGEDAPTKFDVGENPSKSSSSCIITQQQKQTAGSDALQELPNMYVGMPMVALVEGSLLGPWLAKAADAEQSSFGRKFVSRIDYHIPCLWLSSRPAASFCPRTFDMPDFSRVITKAFSSYI